MRRYKFIFAALFLLTSVPYTEAEVSAIPKPQFEVVSIRLHDPNSPRNWSYHLPGVDIMGTDIIGIISVAFDVDRDRIIGGPGWSRSDFYDIRARTDPSIVSLSAQDQERQIKMMLQSMLSQEFHLSYHSGSKIVQTYSLVAGKNRPHLIASTLGKKSNAVVGVGMMNLSSYSMQDFAQQLSFSTHVIVIDQTNIQGKYDITLRWHPDDFSEEDTRPPLQEAIHEQLGLDLQKNKSAAQTIEIQRIDRPDSN